MTCICMLMRKIKEYLWLHALHVWHITCILYICCSIFYALKHPVAEKGRASPEGSICEVSWFVMVQHENMHV